MKIPSWFFFRFGLFNSYVICLTLSFNNVCVYFYSYYFFLCSWFWTVIILDGFKSILGQSRYRIKSLECCPQAPSLFWWSSLCLLFCCLCYFWDHVCWNHGIRFINLKLHFLHPKNFTSPTIFEGKTREYEMIWDIWHIYEVIFLSKVKANCTKIRC